MEDLYNEIVRAFKFGLRRSKPDKYCCPECGGTNFTVTLEIEKPPQAYIENVVCNCCETEIERR
ncbi:hypothetical protein ES703_06145 [subsurface metagenome]